VGASFQEFRQKGVLMRGANVLTGVAAVVAIFIMISRVTTAEIPSKYRGLWTWSDSCEQTIALWSKEQGEFPFLLVTNEKMIQHESSCKIVSVEHATEKDKLKFRCYGEGEEWELEQEWSAHDKETDLAGGLLFDRMIIKVPTLVVSGPESKTVHIKCGAVCVKGACWGKQ
jgi:hypothetical protein